MARYIYLSRDSTVLHDLKRAFSASERNILLVGPPGSGKTTLAQHIAKSFQKEVVSFSITPRHGYEEIIERIVIKNGSSRGEWGKIVSKLSAGELVIMNELDKGGPSTYTALLPLESGKEITGIYTGESVRIEGKIIATANDLPANKPLVDRFEVVEVNLTSYPDIKYGILLSSVLEMLEKAERYEEAGTLKEEIKKLKYKEYFVINLPGEVKPFDVYFYSPPSEKECMEIIGKISPEFGDVVENFKTEIFQRKKGENLTLRDIKSAADYISLKYFGGGGEGPI